MRSQETVLHCYIIQLWSCTYLYLQLPVWRVSPQIITSLHVCLYACPQALNYLTHPHTQHKIFSEFATPTRLMSDLNMRELWRSSTTVPGALSATLTGLSTMHWWLVEQLAFPLLYVPSRMVPTMGLDWAPCIWTMFIAQGRRLLCLIVRTRLGAMCPAPVTIATMLLLSALTVSNNYYENI